MSSYSETGIIHVHALKLWAHVGVLEKERLLGQQFLLDFSIWVDVSTSSENDQLSLTADYSLAIKGLQALASQINCLTIEHFSHEILNFLENLYGSVPIRVVLEKCSPPIHGFHGSVSIERKRNFLGEGLIS
tara:strand:+ start:346 stop:741 length:396 start_codon:yes stop_codon:yes gene_type:complete